MTKSCTRCSASFEASGKGSTRAKYCHPCRPIVRREQFLKSEQKRNEKRLQERGNIIPDDDNLFFYGYKEPLKKVENGYGYMGVVRYSKEKDMVQCHICGRLYKNVASHAKGTHEIGASEYKTKFGLLQNTALVGEGTREKLILAHKDVKSFSQIGKTKEEIREHMVKMSEKGVKRGKGNRKQHWTLERRNMHGLCPDQLVDRIKKLETKLGRRPTAKEYQQEYGTYASIITVFGTWETAIEKAGIKKYSDERAEHTDPNWLLDQLKFFYKKYGRTARTSDMKRGLLPYHQAYCKEFGTLNNARILAGVPVIIPISKYRYDEVLIEDLRQLERIKESLGI